MRFEVLLMRIQKTWSEKNPQTKQTKGQAISKHQYKGKIQNHKTWSRENVNQQNSNTQKSRQV